MNRATKNYFLIAAIFSFALFFAPVAAFHARAAGLTVMPAVIDDHGLPRDILKYSLTVKNTDDHAVIVFASVYNLTADGKQEFMDTSAVNASLDAKSVSLANWMDVSRASMTFAPGESKTIPVTINVNPFAVAGTYHAVIAFVEGSTRAEAEARLDGAPQALVNLDVASNAKEDLELVAFASSDRFTSSFPVSFRYTIKNVGNVSSTPAGLVIFYDRLGHEIGSVDANPEKASIAPGETHDFMAEWGKGQGFGQYKAMLDLTYGAAGNKLQDVAFVWVLPWQKLMIAFFGLLFIVIMLALWAYRRYEKRHHARMNLLGRLLSDRTHPVLDLRHPDHHPHDDH